MFQGYVGKFLDIPSREHYIRYPTTGKLGKSSKNLVGDGVCR